MAGRELAVTASKRYTARIHLADRFPAGFAPSNVVQPGLAGKESVSSLHKEHSFGELRPPERLGGVSGRSRGQGTSQVDQCAVMPTRNSSVGKRVPLSAN